MPPLNEKGKTVSLFRTTVWILAAAYRVDAAGVVFLSAAGVRAPTARVAAAAARIAAAAAGIVRIRLPFVFNDEMIPAAVTR